MKKIAVMQPYFIPYAGYFRLMQSADVFVIYDCVQFPRKGYVHRNKLRNVNLNQEWLTLPLLKQEQNIKINQLLFTSNAEDTFSKKLERNLIFNTIKNQSVLFPLLKNFKATPSEYIVNLLKHFCILLEIKTQFIYSSKLNISKHLKGQDRILAIASQLNATHYINSPNGKNLYDQNEFSKKNIQLEFLDDYQGDYISILDSYFSKTKEEQALFSEDIKKQSI